MKWVNNAGPRKSKLVVALLQTLSTEINTFNEVCGTVGGEENTYTYWVPFGNGNPNETARAESVRLREKWSGTLTNENLVEVEADLRAAIKLARENRPTIDKRETLEAVAARRAEVAQREAKERADAEEIAQLEAERAPQRPEPSPSVWPGEKPLPVDVKPVLTMNKEKQGIELRFASKPDSYILDKLKAAGWRWSRFSKCWYAKESPRSLAFAYSMVDRGCENGPAEQPAGVDRFDLEYEDRCSRETGTDSEQERMF